MGNEFATDSGVEIAGIIEKTGAKFTSLKPGDAVYGYPTFGGGWAEYVTVKEWEVAPKPKSLSFAEAAAVPMGALTAWQALVDVAQYTQDKPFSFMAAPVVSALSLFKSPKCVTLV